MRRLGLLLFLLLPVATASAAPGALILLTAQSSHGTDVLVAGLDGSGARSLTGGVGLASGPRWSPDGSQVAFATNRDTNGMGPGEIYVVNADGTGLRPVTSGAPAGSYRHSPTWAPDGTEIAYIESRTTGPQGADVWVVPAAGGAPRRMTTDAGLKNSVAWQPHGSLLLYDRAGDPNWALWTVDAHTGVSQRVVGVQGFLSDTSSYWSPDGSQLAFNDPGGRLTVAAVDGSSARTLSSTAIAGAIPGAPAWSADGRSIAVSVARVVDAQPSTRYGGVATQEDVFAIDVATGRAQRLTGFFDSTVFAGGSAAPVWWPNGSRLFYRSGRGPVGVWEMNADGTCEQPVASLSRSLGGPWFQPGAASTGGKLDCVDLRLHATISRPQAALGEQVEVVMTIENDGDLTATGVQVMAEPGSRAVAHVNCPDGSRAPSCALGTLAPGQGRVVSGAVASARAAYVTAQFSVAADQPDATLADRSTSVGTSILPCTIVGSWSADVLDGTSAADRICGLPGADRLSGGRGDDILNGGSGDDTIVGGPGRDTILGGGGRDVVYARDGQLDWIDCGTEYDIAIVDRFDHTKGCDKVVRR